MIWFWPILVAMSLGTLAMLPKFELANQSTSAERYPASVEREPLEAQPLGPKIESAHKDPIKPLMEVAKYSARVSDEGWSISKLYDYRIVDGLYNNLPTIALVGTAKIAFDFFAVVFPKLLDFLALAIAFGSGRLNPQPPQDESTVHGERRSPNRKNFNKTA